MKVSHYWQLRSLHPISIHFYWHFLIYVHATTPQGSNYLPLLFLGRLVNGVTMAGLYTVPEVSSQITFGATMILLTEHFWGNQWSWSSSSIDAMHYDGLLRHTSQGWLAAEQKARELPETQISSTLAQVCIILSICSVTAMGLHITLSFLFSSSFFPPGNLFFITSGSCWGPSSWPSRHGNLLVGMQFYKLCGKW